MKTKILIPGALLVLLCATTQAQFTYTSGNLNASQTYDGLGVDIGLNPYTIPGTSDDYIGSGGTGVLTVLSGTLTINNDDFKAGVNGGNGTLIMGANATLNVNSIASWAPGFAWYGASTATVIISNNATLNFLVNSANEQRLECGGGGASGSLTLNGGAVNVNLGTGRTITDDSAQVMLGAYGSPFTLNLNAGTFTDNMPLPFCMGCAYSGMVATPSLAQNTAASVFNIVNGSLVMTAICPQTDTNKATFMIGTNTYVNFNPSGAGSLSLTNWAAADYLALVTKGTIRIAGTVMPMSNFQYTNDNGRGVLKAGRLVLLPVPITNLVFATTHVTLSVRAYGPGVAGATYQWQTDNGSGGSAFANVSGATGTNYVLDTTGLAGNYQYQLVANSGGNYVTSGIVAVTIQPAGYPQVAQDTSPSALITIYVGQGLTFSASFTGLGPIYYNWQYSADFGSTWTNITAATNTTFTIPSAHLGDAGFYQLQASNVFGANVSTYTWLQVSSGTPTYIWSAPFPFAGLTAEQILTNFPSANKIAGAMVAKNGGDPITVILTNANNQPVVFAGAGAWASLSGGAGYFTGANTNLTGNANFDTCLNDGYYDNATHAITLNGLVVGQQYQVQLFALDDRSLSPAGSARTVNWQDPTNANDTAQTYTMADNVYMLGTFTASSNVMTIQQNMLSSSGNFNCLVLRTVGWNPPPYFTVQPKGGVRYIGENMTLSGSAAGDATEGAVTYRWVAGPAGGPYSNLLAGAKYAGTTNTTLTISNTAPSDALPVYLLVATDNGGSVTSSVVSVAIVSRAVVGEWFAGSSSLADVSGYSPAGTHDGFTVDGSTYSFSGDVPPGRSGQSLALSAGNTGIAIGNSSTLDGAYTNTFDDIINGAMTVTCWAKGLPGGWNPFVSKYGENGLAWQLRVNGSGNTPCWTIRGTGGNEDMSSNLGSVDGSFWHHYAGTYSAATGVRSLYVDGVLAVTQTNQGPLNPSAASHLVIGARDNGGNSFGNYFTGNIYDVRVYDYDLTASQVAQLAVLPDPVILGQPPTNTTAYAGFNVQISATVKGTAPMTNQWKFNGTNLVDGAYGGVIILGSTSNVLTMYGVTTNNLGVYTLALSNSLGSTISSNATITLVSPVPPPATNLVGAWVTGAANLADTSGYSPAGTHDGYGVTGSGTPASNYSFNNDVPRGAPGQSLQLNGNTAIAISNSATVDASYTNTYDDATGSMSIVFWAKGYPGNWNPWVSKYGEGPGWQLRDEGDNADSGFTLRGAGGTVTLGSAVYGNSDDNRGTIASADGNWHLYAATYNRAAGIRNWYVDGALSGQVTGITTYNLAAASHLTIGGRDGSAGNSFGAYFTGKFYGVRFYNAAITADQVNSFVSPAPPPPPAFSVKPAVTTGPHGRQFVLTWTYGTLLQATNLAGPWTTNTASRPYTVIISNAPSMFFKLSYP